MFYVSIASRPDSTIQCCESPNMRTKIIILDDVLFTIIIIMNNNFSLPLTVVGCSFIITTINHCTFYVLRIPYIDYTVDVSYNVRDYLSIEPRESGGYHGPKT